MQRIQRTLGLTIVVSEFSHIFCCVLPTVFSMTSFLVTFGVLSAMPVFMVEMHDVLHHWEIPIILFSGFLLAFGWGAHFYSAKIDCHSTGCVHGSCAPVKRKASRLLALATLIFIANVVVYLGVHYGGEALLSADNAAVLLPDEAVVHTH